MDTLRQRGGADGAGRHADDPDGTIGFRRLAVGLVGDCASTAMEMAVEEGVRRNGCRERDTALLRAACDRAVEEVAQLGDAREDALAHLALPAEHRLMIRTNNVQERASREIRCRTDVTQAFPSSHSLVRLVGAAPADRNDGWAVGHFTARRGCATWGAARSPRAHRGGAAQGGGNRAGRDARRGLDTTIGQNRA